MIKKLLNNKRDILFCFLTLAMISLPFQLLAATDYKLQADWPPSPAGTTLTAASTITNLIQYAYEWGISLGIFAVFIMLISGGVKYMSSTGDPQKTKAALDKIRSSALGLLLLLSSWAILHFLNPELTTLKIPDFNNDLQNAINKKNQDSQSLSSLYSAKKCDFAFFYTGTNYGGGTPVRREPRPDTESIPNQNLQSVRILRTLQDEEIKTIKDEKLSTLQLYERNKLIEANPKITEAEIEQILSSITVSDQDLRDAIEVKYGTEPYPEDGKYYVDDGVCSVDFYTIDTKYAVFSEDSYVGSIGKSTPDLTKLWPEGQLKNIKKIRINQGE